MRAVFCSSGLSLLLAVAALEVASAGEAEGTEKTCPAKPDGSVSSSSLLARSKVVRKVSTAVVEDSLLSERDLGGQSLDGEDLADVSLGLELAGEDDEVAASLQQAEEVMAVHAREYVARLRSEMAEARRAAGGAAELDKEGYPVAMGAPHEETVDPSTIPDSRIDPATHYPIQLKCSSSCGPNSQTPCALILVLHGLGMDAGLMIWVTLGQDLSASGGFSEENGPFCAAFLKSSGNGWDYKYDGHDSKLIYAAIKHVETTRTVDQDRLYMHGYSSGATMTWQMACGPLGSRLAGIAPYAGGLRWNVQCNWRQHVLVSHGTRDCIVPYDPDQNQPAPSAGGSLGFSCEQQPNADRTLPLKSTLSPWATKPFYAGTGARLAFQAAVVSGYNEEGPTLPQKARSMDFAQSDAKNYNIAADQTDEFVYPVDPDACGSSTLWRMQNWNHDYPNKRKGTYGTTYFWQELLRWLMAHVRCRPRVTRACSTTGATTACGTPVSTQAFLATEGAGANAEACRYQCERSKGCAEGWYVPKWYRCYLYGFPWSASACTARQSWGDLEISVFNCVEEPAPTPPPTLPTPLPTPPPTDGNALAAWR